MSKLIIVESPTKAKTIKKHLADGYDVKATMGHIRDLPKSKFGVEIEKKNSYYEFEPTYVISKKKSDTIKEVKKAVKKADEIYLATDPDREGEAIAYHTKYICTHNKGKVSAKKFKRISFHEITKSAIDQAMEKQGKIDMDLVNAQQARRILDRIVGYTLSPLLWKKIRRGLSAGRVQSVAVRLVVEREREREDFKSKKYYRVQSKFDDFTAQLIKIAGKSITKREKIKLFAGTHTVTTTILNSEKKAKKVIKDLSPKYEITEIKKKTTSKNPYAPYTTSSLQQDASYKLNWSSKLTMSVAQKLFEKGHITYHRTDSTNLAKSAINRARKYIGKKYGKKYLPEKARRYKTKSKLAQEAHEAIRPTDIGQKAEKLKGKRAKKLYDLIWKRTVACQMASAKLARTRIRLKNKKYLFSASGSQVLFKGFAEVYPTKLSETILPELKEGQKLKAKEVEITDHESKPPARYNEASLIADLKEHGIGRPSTYAPIISTIQSRQYVEKENAYFLPTPIGNTVTDFLVKHFPDIMALPFTAEMENSLDEIAQGEEEWEPVLSDFWGPFHKKVEKVEEKAERMQIPVEKTGKKCPECKEGELVIRTGKYGKFLSCSRFPDCKYTEPYHKKAGFKCPECGKPAVIKKTKKGSKFYSCSNWPDCDWSSWKKPKELSE